MRAQTCPNFPTALAHMSSGSLAGRSASELAALIAAGEISALECIEAQIARIEQVNPSLNAVVVKRYDEARNEARAVDRRRIAGEALPPLAGVPVTIKECLDLAQTPSTFGLVARRGRLATADVREVASLRAAGAVALGKTNVAQALFFVESDNPVYGRTNNPYDADRTCGGSSGGEAAIIAAGGSSLGLGTDVGGSLRIPAAFCGVASMKPTAGRFPDYGTGSLSVGQTAIASQIGVLARTAGDVALGLEALEAGRDPFQPAPTFGDFRSVDVTRLRIGWYAEDGVFPSSPAVRRAVEELVSSLSAAGAQVVGWSPPHMDEAVGLVLSIFSADGGVLIKQLLAGGPVHPTLKTVLGMGGLPRPLLRLLPSLLTAIGQPSLAALPRFFGNTRTVDYWRIVERLIDYRRRFAEAMDRAEGGPLDLIVGPVCALPAFRHGATKDLSVGGGHTFLYNALGYPAGVVPVTRVRADEQSGRPASRDLVVKAAKACDENSADLPIGVQIAARPWREHTALAAMQVVEQRA